MSTDQRLDELNKKMGLLISSIQELQPLKCLDRKFDEATSQIKQQQSELTDLRVVVNEQQQRLNNSELQSRRSNLKIFGLNVNLMNPGMNQPGKCLNY